MFAELADIVARANKVALLPDPGSPYYGRYLLSGDQVAPNYRPSYDIYLRLLPGTEPAVCQYYEEMPSAVQGLFQVFDDGELRNPLQCISYPFNTEDRLLVFSMLGDFCYVGEENIYAAFAALSPYVEDSHFFVYSSWFSDRWVHEYNVRQGNLTIERHVIETEPIVGAMDLYLARDDASPSWIQFVRDMIAARAARVSEACAHKWVAKLEDRTGATRPEPDS